MSPEAQGHAIIIGIVIFTVAMFFVDRAFKIPPALHLVFIAGPAVIVTRSYLRQRRR